MAQDADPHIPAAVRPTWDELNDHAIPVLRALELERTAAADRVEALIVTLLRAGVRREELVGRPYSSAWLTRIQRSHGLIARRRPRGATPS